MNPNLTRLSTRDIAGETARSALRSLGNHCSGLVFGTFPRGKENGVEPTPTAADSSRRSMTAFRAKANRDRGTEVDPFSQDHG